MRKNFTITPVLYSRKDKNNLYPVKLRITENRKSNFINLDFSIPKSHWLKSTRRVSVSNPNHQEFNFIIERKIKEYENVSKKYGVVKVGKMNLFEDLEKKISGLKGKQYYTGKRYRTLYYHLEKFWGNLELNYYEIDKDFFTDFKQYLQDNITSRNEIQLSPSNNTIVNYLNTLKTFLLEKQREGIYVYDLNFTRGIIPTKKTTPKRTLDIEEIWKLDNLLPSHYKLRPLLWDSLNSFMFNFWSQGLRIGDCLRLKWGNIQDDVIVLTMEKTQRELIIPLNASNIHRIKWYMEKYYPIWDWKTKKWNDYNNNNYEDVSSYYDLLYSQESGYNEFLQMIEHEKDVNFEQFESDNSFDVERFGQDRNGVKYHRYIMEKSKPLFEFLNQRIEIVNKELLYCIKDYSSQKSNKNKFIFPFLRGFENEKDINKLSNKVSSSIALINKCLREVGEISGINKKFSNHWSRHTITSISRGLGVDMYELKTWLGHTSVKTTETYVNTISTHSSLKNSKNIKELLERPDSNI